MPLQKIIAWFQQFPTVDLPKNQIIFHYQQPLIFIYLVKSGFLECSSIFSRQGDTFPLAIVSPKEITPLTAITRQSNLRHIINTITPSILYRAPLDQFLIFIQDKPEIQTYLQEKTNRVLYDLINHLEILLNSTAEKKVFNVLTYLLKNFSRKTKIGQTLKFTLTHKKLAAFCNLSRETTTKIVGKLIKQGKFQYQHHYFSAKLCDLDYKTHYWLTLTTITIIITDEEISSQIIKR